MKRLSTLIASAALVVVCAAAINGTAATSAPNPTLTPGATNPAVTDSTIRQTICVSGYTKTYRHVTATTKRAVYTEYGIPRSQQRHYTIDHLIPLEVGGSNDLTNLWPEPNTGTDDATTKDRDERTLHRNVCSGRVTLEAAQQTILTKWGGASIAPAPTQPPTTPTAPPPPTQPPPPPTLPPAPTTRGNGATALCNDGTYSYAAHHQGACSYHGGVREFYR
jgi:hypothetical protein